MIFFSGRTAKERNWVSGQTCRGLAFPIGVDTPEPILTRDFNEPLAPGQLCLYCLPKLGLGLLGAVVIGEDLGDVVVDHVEVSFPGRRRQVWSDNKMEQGASWHKGKVNTTYMSGFF